MPLVVLCAAVSTAFSVWFTAAAVLQPALAKYLPIGIVFLAILLAALGFLLPSASHQGRKA